MAPEVAGGARTRSSGTVAPLLGGRERRTARKSGASRTTPSFALAIAHLARGATTKAVAEARLGNALLAVSGAREVACRILATVGNVASDGLLRARDAEVRRRRLGITRQERPGRSDASEPAGGGGGGSATVDTPGSQLAFDRLGRTLYSTRCLRPA
jgi:hypothetical protein